MSGKGRIASPLTRSSVVSPALARGDIAGFSGEKPGRRLFYGMSHLGGHAALIPPSDRRLARYGQDRYWPVDLVGFTVLDLGHRFDRGFVRPADPPHRSPDDLRRAP
ncbi:hypothetical protein GCM10029978_081140 [Actinoallomurus acanthiterrae]